MNLTELVKTKFLPPLMQGKEGTFNEDLKAEYGASYESNEYGSGYVPWIKHTEGDSRGIKRFFLYKSQPESGNSSIRFQTFYSKVEDAIKHCWRGFEAFHNDMESRSKLEIKNES